MGNAHHPPFKKFVLTVNLLITNKNKSMKKNNHINGKVMSFWRWKIFLIMKLLTVFILAFILQSNALETQAQNKRLSLQFENKTLKEVLLKLQDQTEFSFIYKDELINSIDNVSGNFKDEKMTDLLNKILQHTGLTYMIEGRAIVILSNDSRAVIEQQKTVSGKVTDSNGGLLPGVTVAVKGTTNGNITDANGNFSLPNIASDATLVFSFVGMKTQEVKVGTKTTFNIVLEEESIGLDEVIAIGYGVQRKSDLTGSVGSIKEETLLERPATSVSQILAGRVAGVNVSVNSGTPGGRANIRIRGNTSISITNEPLYIIDGIVSSIDYINPNDISTIVILKDASSTAIYGARGSNGVILVTTKRGIGDGPKVSYDTQYSLGQLPRELDFLTSKEYLQVEDIAYQNAQKYDPEGWAVGKYVDPKLKRTNPLLFDANGNPLYNTDWQKESTQNAFSQNHNLSVTGGDAKYNYGIFLGYRNEEGIIKTSDLKRYSSRFVIDSQIKTWLKVGGSLNFNNQNEHQVEDSSGGITLMREMAEQLPIIPVKFPDGSWASNENYPNTEFAPNPVQIMNELNNTLLTQTVLGNIYANITLTKDFEFKSTLGTSIIDGRRNLYKGRDLNYISRNQKGRAEVSSTYNTSWQFENYLTYNKKISEIHSFTGLLGVSWQHVDNYRYQATTWNFQDDFFQTNNLGIGANPQPPTSAATAYGLNSYFSRINYNLKEKYLLTVSGRVDGSSKFGIDKRYAFFPSAALAWRASEENFIKSMPTISNLKLRASYGSTGNFEIPDYQALAGLGNYSVIFNDSRTSGIGIGRLPNPSLKWEKTNQADFGMELGLLKNRISLEVDLYNKQTNNMLLNTPIPRTSGYTSVTKNIGSMENRGIEFNLNTVIISSKDFSWNTTFNISINRNKVLALGETNADVFPGPGTTNIARVGYPIGSFYGYNRLGTWGTDEEAEAAKFYRLPGDLKFEDINKDGMINSLDRVILGKGIPDGTGSLINTFSYKNFDLTLDLQFMYGNDIYVAARYTQEDRVGITNSRSTVLNAWTPENQNTPIAQSRPVVAGYDSFNDSHMVENGSFIRGRNLLLAYNFSSEITKKIHLSKLRLTASIQNFFVLTKYTGYDPEVSSYSDTFGQGITNYFNDYPKPRVIMIGLYTGF